KYGLCDTVILPSRRDLGGDKYIRLENELFLDRNGVRTVFIRKQGADHLHDIVVAAKRYCSYACDWDKSYGVRIPDHFTFDVFRRTPPFGYKVVDGKAVVDEENAETVNLIFDMYADGKSIFDICKHIEGTYSTRNKPFGNMTVKTVLRNERYLGLQSKKGYHLPPIIRYDKWLAVHERLEREYPPAPFESPYYERIYSDRPVRFIRSGMYFGSFDDAVCYVDPDILEERIEETVKQYASEGCADLLFDTYISKELSEADSAYRPAAAAYNKALGEFNKCLKRVCEGEFDEELQARLEHLTDIRNVYAMRLRRIRSEQQLFSIKNDELRAFFKRASRIDELSREEKKFISEAFIWAVRIKDGEVMAYVRDPNDGKLNVRILNNVLI
ncbi:MAG: recombinase family protein, partial [Clostridia bacterium]|nr:recombinase family protein [Clostridia bacterium]